MRLICDSCGSAAAVVFCAADEAALCPLCDHQVHSCNKLASRHVRVGLADPSEIPKCDICERDSAFFYCEIDGTSLCLQCDMHVHVGGKRTHERYLLLRQRVEFPGDKTGSSDDVEDVRGDTNQPHRPMMGVNNPNHRISLGSPHTSYGVGRSNGLFDLNSRPLHIRGETSNNQEQEVVGSSDADNEPPSVVPDVYIEKEFEK